MSILKSFSFNFCNIEDCRFCKDGQCSVGLDWDSEKCRIVKEIPKRPVKLFPAEKKFYEHDFRRLTLDTFTKGQQEKWVSHDNKTFLKERFYYESRFWNDCLVEIIASKICKDLGINAVNQQLGLIENRPCVYSDVFEEEFISYTSLTGKDSFQFSDPIDNVKDCIDNINKRTAIDVTEYIFNFTLVDFLVCNEDRHLRNFGVFYNGCRFKVAKLFDFGLGLFEHDTKYNNKTLEQALALISEKPFRDWDKVLNYFASLGFAATGTVNLEGIILPNELSREYLKWSFEKVGIKLCGI